jgi:hypothetical protein
MHAGFGGKLYFLLTRKVFSGELRRGACGAMLRVARVLFCAIFKILTDRLAATSVAFNHATKIVFYWEILWLELLWMIV